MIIKSIRARIQIWHTALLSLLVISLLTAFYFHEKEIKIKDLDSQLRNPITRLMPLLLAPPPRSMRVGPEGPLGKVEGPLRSQEVNQNTRQRPPPSIRGPRKYSEATSDTERIQIATHSLIESGIYVFVLGPQNNIRFRTENAPDSQLISEEELPRGPRSQRYIESEHYREYQHRSPSMETIILGTDIQLFHKELANLRWTLVGLGTAIIAFGFAIGWFLIGRSLKPIHSISETALDIERGNRSRRIDLSETGSELGQLGTVLNSTFSKLDEAFEQQIRFTADASHELRTPIAVIIAKCQFALRREREPEKYKEALATCEASAQYIRGLVNSLLELAKVDSGEFQVIRTPSKLDEVAESSIDMLATLADEKGITLKKSLEPLEAFIDPSRIHQVAINLISNAIKYTQPGGIVKVWTRRNHGECQFGVQDNGPGIHGKELPHLFDRFYKVEKERSNEKRSTGLGLAITKAIVEAHGGQITVESRLGEGSSFIVSIPQSEST